MQLIVRLYANLVRYRPGARSGRQFTVELPDDSQIGDLIKHLGIPEEEVKTVFVNHIISPPETVLHQGDEVGIFSPIGGGLRYNQHMGEITVEAWLYGDLAKYAGQAARPSYANLQIHLPKGGTIAMLLEKLGIPTQERGITFINGNLSAMVGMQPDLHHVLSDGDRVAFFHLQSMWPFQYRHGVQMISEMTDAIESSEDGGVHHSYDK